MKILRVNEIDLLRFIAALMVVFFHYAFRGYAADNMTLMHYPLLAPMSKYGYYGVQLFFMISGFVILMTAARGSLKSFAISRFIRLYPAFWACCTITFVVILVIGESRYMASMSQYLVNMTMLSEFFGVAPIDGAYWSLFVEMRFYVLVAMILVIGRIHQAQLLLVLWLIASIALERHYIAKLYYLLIVDYSAFFIAGATYFLIWSKGISLARVMIITLSWMLALFQTIGKISHVERNFNTHLSSFIVAGIITTFFILMLLISLKMTGFWGRNKWLLAGALTYPLYLLHQNVGFMIFNVAYSTINPHLLFWGTILIVLGLAYAVHILVEKRFTLPLKNIINNLVDTIQHLTMPILLKR
jgi:peptidoglycan/LPS O-acetylase OafA/YrhL